MELLHMKYLGDAESTASQARYSSNEYALQDT